MVKLKDRQFYNVGTGRTEMVPTDYIEVVKWEICFIGIIKRQR